MASQFYPKFKQACLQGNASLDGVAVKAIMVDEADYTFDASHEFLSDVALAARVAISPALTSKTFTDGTFNSDNPVLPNVSGDPTETVILFIDTGVEGTSRLICKSDVAITPNGTNVTLNVNVLGWFTL